MASKIHLLVTGLLVLIPTIGSRRQNSSAEQCFCNLKGGLDDCSCDVESIDSFNNGKIHPLLEELLGRNYFRYFKVNLNKDCPFWYDDSKCALKDCAVDICTEEVLPEGMRNGHEVKKYMTDSLQEKEECDEMMELSTVDTTLSQESKDAFVEWTEYDDSQLSFCAMDDEDENDMQYVDLLLNPERYTGYKGESPHRIWRSIYEENCFKPVQSTRPSYSPNIVSKGSPLEGLCLEKRVFYRVISGLHSSINIHLCARHLLPADGHHGDVCLTRDGWGRTKWGPKLEEFRKRFSPESVGPQGTTRLKNLYFVYLLELRALVKAAPYFLNQTFYTGDRGEDDEVRQLLMEVLDVARQFPYQFDENTMFQGDPKEARRLKEEFRQHFWNVTRIMDCVGCDKCRLWGKLQVHGLGTALKVLFSGDIIGRTDIPHNRQFHMTRREIVALVNAFGRLSKSIRALEDFKNMMTTS
ncbi:ERO1-like protein beta [Branchiostoma floridae]|uniref:ERO1-like protein beta n=1 Tax=Branchiostoma floridae TaxID=7739 RepID=A0A9J7M777_BRAFL|nr:ERO1-like protein beta [Branchiostoma floridae]